ncbi:MAG TPA: hypothetical protein VJQ51_09740 [Burkholderiales bacterium]|nr:hypothetical protein [Burkholderiales bacterium]
MTSKTAARHFYMVTFEIAQEDEALFNEIYDTEHVPNIMKVDGCLGVVRFRDKEKTAGGWILYSAIYLLTEPDLPTTPQWKKASDTGRWGPVMRPRMKSRSQRLGSIADCELAKLAAAR